MVFSMERDDLSKAWNNLKLGLLNFGSFFDISSLLSLVTVSY